MLEELKEKVCQANRSLPRLGLVTLTWGNVSGLDRGQGLMVIKPSGVDYDELTPGKMVVVDFQGRVKEGGLKPSSDTATHLELYRSFPGIGGVAHTHSRHATIFAQKGLPIEPYGTTHADFFHGPVPCTRPLTDEEIASGYELATGQVIAQAHPDYEGVPAALVANHGPFAWGRDPAAAAENAAALEEIAAMALACLGSPKVSQALLDKHYYRKHGREATYGQK
jgi:L-ribulose-5-phosphate 4-epimerase